MKIVEIADPDNDLDLAEAKSIMIELYQSILNQAEDLSVSDDALNNSIEFFEKWVHRIEIVILNNNLTSVSADASFIYNIGSKLIDKLKNTRH